MTQHLITIEKLVVGGLGLGRLPDGMVVMLPGVLPGETVLFEPVRTKRSYCEARLVSIMDAAPERVEPPCAVYGECGGCDLQHASDAAQLRLKHAILSEQFERSGLVRQGVSLPVIAEVLPSPQTFGYRQRLKMQMARGVPGFYHHRTHRHVPVSHCLIARKEINAVLEMIHKKAHAVAWAADLSALEIQSSPATGRVVCIFHLARPLSKADNESAWRLTEQSPLVSGVVVVGCDGRRIKRGALDVDRDRACKIEYNLEREEGAEALHMMVSDRGFCQVNPEQNARLVALVRNWASGERLLDLYCGNGNFSVPMSSDFVRILGIDSETDSIRSAMENSSRAGSMNCCFESGRASEKAASLFAAGERFDLVLLDPPRQGCDPGLAALAAKLAHRSIIYISCDPATLIRDLREILFAGFTVEAIQPVDMFPQTHHIETAVLLQLQKDRH